MGIPCFWSPRAVSGCRSFALRRVSKVGKVGPHGLVPMGTWLTPKSPDVGPTDNPQIPFLWDFKHPQMIGLLYWLCHIHVFLYSISVFLCANVAFWRQVGNASFEHLLGPSCGSDLDWCRETVSPETTFFFTPKSPRVSCKLSHL